MKNVYLVGLGVLLSMSVACAASSDGEQNGEGAAELQGDRDLKPAPNPNPGPSPEPNPAPAPAPAPTCKTLASPGGSGGMGLANPASVYCAELGYVASGETCAFPDGTSCEQWAFYRGGCGQAHSFCNRNGGQVSMTTEDAGGWTATYAICTLSTGASCKEQDFASTCQCE